MVKNMTTGDSLKLLFGFMVPLIIGNIFQQIYSISDIIIVGRAIGVNALAAVGAAAPIFMLFVMITLGLTNGFTVLTGQFYGAGNLEKVRRSVATSTTLSLISVVLLDILIFGTLDWTLELMNMPEVLYQDARSYVAIIAAGLWAMMGYNFLSGILRALGDSRTPLYFLIIGVLVNIVLALLFIIPLGWGVPGSAYALVLSEALSVVLCLFYIRKKFPELNLRKGDWKWDTAFAWQHLKMGIPMAGQFSVIGIGILLIQAVCNKFGPDYIAGFTAAMRVEQLALQPMISFGIAMAVFCAQNYGARKFDRIRSAVRKCSMLAVLFSLVSGLVVFFFSQDIVAVFMEGDHPRVMDAAVRYLHYSVPFYFFLSQIFIYRGSVQGMGIGSVPLISATIELVMRTGAAEILTEWWGYKGICYASPIAWVAASIFLFSSFHYFLRLFEREERKAREKREAETV